MANNKSFELIIDSSVITKEVAEIILAGGTIRVYEDEDGQPHTDLFYSDGEFWDHLS